MLRRELPSPLPRTLGTIVQRTLFVIPVPEELFGLPVLGWGWLLILWAVIAAIWMVVILRRGGSSQEVMGHLPLFLVVAAAIVFVLPSLWVVEGNQAGFPVRGYGVLLVFGIVSGVGMAAYRAQRMGVNPELIYALAMVLIVAGIVGARVFFVLQYWENFYVPGDVGATLFEIFKVTEGGIVVYGSLIGAAIAFAVFCYRKKLPALALADLIAPSLLIGLFFGRIGCFLNGCCYGGLCTLPVAVYFPQGIAPQYTPPYIRHMENGAFYGVLFSSDEEGTVRVANVLPNTPASESGQVAVGDVVEAVNGVPLADQKAPPLEVLRYKLLESWSTQTGPRRMIVLKLADKPPVRLVLPDMPPTSLGVHPTQLYSSINAMVLCLLMLAYYPLQKYDGETISLTLGLYGITRFLEEAIRTDEYAIGGTGLTISQNVSIVVFVLALILFIAVRVRKEPLAWPRATA